MNQFKKITIEKTNIGNQGQRDKADKCEICSRQFSLICKQHQCKRCLRPVCHECGKDKAITYHYDLNVKHRMCKLCMLEQKEIARIISDEKLNFAQNSQISKRWIKYFDQKKSFDIMQKQIQQEYQDIQQNIIQRSTENIQNIHRINESLDQLDYMLKILTENYHYSMWELHYLMTNKIQQKKKINECVQSVIKALLFSQPELKLQPRMVEQALFLLYFNDQAITYYLLCFLYGLFIPERFKIERNFDSMPTDDEIDFLMEMSKTNYMIQQIDFIYIRKFIENYSNCILSRLMMNVLNVPSILFLYEIFFKEQDFYECEKCFVLIIKIHLQTLKCYGQERDYMMRYILNNSQKSQLVEQLSKEDRMRPQSLQPYMPKSDQVFRHFSEIRQTLSSRSGSVVESRFTSQQSNLIEKGNESEIQLEKSNLIEGLSFLQQIIEGTIQEDQLNKYLLTLQYQEKLAFNKIRKSITQNKSQYLSQISEKEDEFNGSDSNKSENLKDIDLDIDNKNQRRNLSVTFEQNQKQGSINHSLQKQNEDLQKKLDKEINTAKNCIKQYTDLEIKQNEMQVQLKQKDLQIIELNKTIDQMKNDEIKQLNEKINDLELKSQQQRQDYDRSIQQTMIKQQQQIEKLINDQNLIVRQDDQKKIIEQDKQEIQSNQQEQKREPLQIQNNDGKENQNNPSIQINNPKIIIETKQENNQEKNQNLQQKQEYLDIRHNSMQVNNLTQKQNQSVLYSEAANRQQSLNNSAFVSKTQPKVIVQEQKKEESKCYIF